MAITQSAPLTGMPTTIRQALSSNYIDFATASTSDGWAQQYLPDLIEKEAEVFGNRTISGFLSQVGAEEAMTSDQVVWSEQGRLHLSFKGHVESNAGGTASGGQIQLEKDIDGQAVVSGSLPIRVNDTVLIANSEGVVRCIVEAVATDIIDVQPYSHASLNTAGLSTTGGSETTTVLVYGSEYGKGMSYLTAGDGSATDTRGSVEPRFKSFTNKPIIMKDYYEVSGSDASRIGWVEVSTEAGQSGYLWYLKAESDTRSRFTDYIEMSMLESVKGDDSVAATSVDAQIRNNGDVVGTQGLFDAIEDRGNITTGVTGVNAATDLAEFDAILAEFDKQGAIEEYMMFVNRSTSLAIDDMLASMNSYGAGGTSYGVFDNDEDMALNLGFSGFRRGSYDFYKTDWKYLNQMDARAQINSINAAAAIRGVMIPAGVMSVYDQMLGKNMKRPFLHVRYRASQTDNRRFKSWVTGSVGAVTSDLDAMEVHYLSERCLVTQGANNFFLFKGGVAA